jgi:hypothetical protein
MDVGQKIVQLGAKVTQGGAKKVILDIGHKFGHKFKPWKATRMASKATKALKCLGPALEVFSLALDIKDTVAENTAAKEQQKARGNLYKTLDDIKEEIRNACDVQKAEFIKTVFDSRLESLEELQRQIAETNDSNRIFNEKLNHIESEIRDIQELVFGSNIDYSLEEENEYNS